MQHPRGSQEELIQDFSSMLEQSTWPVASLPSNFSLIPAVDEVPYPKASNPCLMAQSEAP